MTKNEKIDFVSEYLDHDDLFHHESNVRKLETVSEEELDAIILKVEDLKNIGIGHVILKTFIDDERGYIWHVDYVIQGSFKLE